MEQKHSSLLIITEDSPESYSPAGERIRHLALASGSTFSKVTVLTLQAAKTRKTATQNESTVSLYEVDFSRAMPFPLSGFFDPVKMLMLLVHGFFLYRRVKPFHVLASMPPFEAGLSAWLISKLYRSKLVIDVRDDWESAVSVHLKKYFPMKLISMLSTIANSIYASASGILTVTQTIAETIRKRGVTTSTFLVPNGADTKLFKPENRDVRIKAREDFALPNDRTIAVYCGSGINPYYRLDLVLRAIKALPDDVAKKLLVVFYIYNGFDQLSKLKRQLAISDEVVKIRKPLPRNKLAKVMSACDVGLVPFDAKPYLLCARSTKLYEYLSSGLYVLGSGPNGGELDLFLSANPHLGLFTAPSVSNFALTFQLVAERTGNLCDNILRESRHAFIREHYDREKVMRQAVRVIQANS